MVLGQESERAGMSPNGTSSIEQQRLIGRTIRKRDGRVVPFDRSRIAHAVEMAVRAELGCPFPDPIAAAAAKQVDNVVDSALAKLPTVPVGEVVATVEEIQDEVERAADGRWRLRRGPPLHRLPRGARPAPRRGRRCAWSMPTAPRCCSTWRCCAPGSPRPARATRTASRPRRSRKRCWLACTSGAALADLERSIVLAARTRIEIDPAYSFVAARGLLRGLYAEALGRRVGIDEAHVAYASAFGDYVKQAVALELLAPDLLEFDLERLGAALAPERDLPVPVSRPADPLRPLPDPLRRAAASSCRRCSGCGWRWAWPCNEDEPRGAGDRVLQPDLVLPLLPLDADPVQRRHALSRSSPPAT